MQRVAVVVDRQERLKCRTDVVELDLLSVERATGCLDVVLQLLRPLRRAVHLTHRDRPDSPRDPPDHGVLGVHAIREEERQVGRERVDVHAARPVRLDVRKPVR